MIELIGTPEKWTAVYQPCIYVFQDVTALGNYTITDNYTYNKRVIDAGVGIVNYFVGQVVRFTIGLNTFTGTITAIDGVQAITDLPTALSSTTAPVFQLNNEPLEVTLKVGKLSSGVAMFDFCTIYAVPLLGTYTLDVSGYLQDYFSNIQKPPALGIDAELYCNYQLNDTLLRYGLYSTQVDVSDLLVGDILRVGTIETFTPQRVIYTRLMASNTQNFSL